MPGSVAVVATFRCGHSGVFTIAPPRVGDRLTCGSCLQATDVAEAHRAPKGVR